MGRRSEPGDGARAARREPYFRRETLLGMAFGPRRDEWADSFSTSVVPQRRAQRAMRIVGPLLGVVWAVFLVQPAEAAWNYPEPALRWVSFVAVVLLGLTFVWVVLRNRPLAAPFPARVAWALVAVQLALVALSTLAAHSDGLGGIVFLCVSAVFLFRDPRVLLGAVAASVVSLVVPRLAGWQPQDGIVVSVVLATVAVYGFTQLVDRNRQLRLAQDEVAVLAVERERERIARDMHDILGHSLTVISVKAELASRLFDVDVERARAEISEVNALARSALADVRAMVTATRAVTLAGELAGARQAFDSAAIEAEVPGTIDQVPDELRELFAWGIREGTTNVLRHSDASRVRIVMTEDTLTLDDDGEGLVHDPAAGNGLRGLTERARAAGARVSASRSPLGGFRLCVTTAPRSSEDPAELEEKQQ